LRREGYYLPDGTQYAYSVARIRAVERNLIDRQKLDRMVEAKSPDEALKVLLDAGYGSPGGDVLNVYEYETLLKEESKKVYSLLKEIAPQPEVFDMFLQKNDYHNAKVILKSEFLGGKDNDDILIDSASIPVNKLKIMIRERKMKEMPPIMREAIEECIDTFNRTGDPQSIDLILDRAAYANMVKLAEATKEPFIIELVRIMVDLTNLKIFFRIKAMKKSWDFLQKILLPGGSIEHGRFISMLQGSLEEALSTLDATPYASIVAEGIEDYQRTGSLTKFEKLADNYTAKFIKKARYISLGVEPLVAYLLTKETEIKNARIIMVGKINGISNDIIRERLRESYV